MKFNSLKLQEELRAKRIIKEGMSVHAAAREADVSKHQYTRAEKYGGMDIEVFTKLVTWLGKNPDNYFNVDLPMILPEQYVDVKRGLYIAMKTLDEKNIDQKLCDRIEVIHDNIYAS